MGPYLVCWICFMSWYNNNEKNEQKQAGKAHGCNMRRKEFDKMDSIVSIFFPLNVLNSEHFLLLFFWNIKFHCFDMRRQKKEVCGTFFYMTNCLINPMMISFFSCFFFLVRVIPCGILFLTVLLPTKSNGISSFGIVLLDGTKRDKVRERDHFRLSQWTIKMNKKKKIIVMMIRRRKESDYQHLSAQTPKPKMEAFFHRIENHINFICYSN